MLTVRRVRSWVHESEEKWEVGGKRRLVWCFIKAAMNCSVEPCLHPQSGNAIAEPLGGPWTMDSSAPQVCGISQSCTFGISWNPSKRAWYSGPSDRCRKEFAARLMPCNGCQGAPDPA